MRGASTYARRHPRYQLWARLAHDASASPATSTAAKSSFRGQVRSGVRRSAPHVHGARHPAQAKESHRRCDRMECGYDRLPNSTHRGPRRPGDCFVVPRRGRLHLPRAGQGFRARPCGVPVDFPGPAARHLRHGAQQHVLALFGRAVRRWSDTGRTRERTHDAACRGAPHRRSVIEPERRAPTTLYAEIRSTFQVLRRNFARSGAAQLSLRWAREFSGTVVN
jgi:hypothetical protein